MIAGFVLRKDGETQRSCAAHPDRAAIGSTYQANAMGQVDRTSKTLACEECAKKAGYKGTEAAA